VPLTLQQFEDLWIAQSTPEEVYFNIFPNQPVTLRRSHHVRGALASLEFGAYQGLDGKWVADQRAVWLNMIMSDVVGDGGHLLDALTRMCGRARVVLIGQPNAMKPRGWDTSRPFDHAPEALIGWYMRHGFKVVQDGSSTRVIHAPLSSMLNVQFSLA